jgi:hypothetical protein
MIYKLIIIYGIETHIEGRRTTDRVKVQEAKQYKKWKLRILPQLGDEHGFPYI